jgi:hemolysin III
MATIDSHIAGTPEIDCSEPKPLMRGWAHALAAVAAIVFWFFLFWRAGDNGTLQAVAAVFGGSMVLLYSVSALFHRWYWTGRWYTLLHALDHANIFVKIAGAYTPFCLVALRNGIGPWLLAIVWVLALLGMAGSTIALRLPRWATTAQYLALGWIAVAAAPSLAAALPGNALALLAVAGVLYTAGALAYAARRPNPFPNVFGYHEVFHTVEVVASACIAAVVWFWVL